MYLVYGLPSLLRGVFSLHQVTGALCSLGIEAQSVCMIQSCGPVKCSMLRVWICPGGSGSGVSTHSEIVWGLDRTVVAAS